MIAAHEHAAAWHDAECGAYAADLALWAGLAEEAAGPVLELGCGTGRVALELAARGHEVAGLDRAPELLEALRRSASERGLAVETAQADACDFSLAGRFGLVCAPMQLAHLLGTGGRRSMLAAAGRHLRPGGRVGIALLAELAVAEPGTPLPLPDLLERGDWVYSSQPVEVVRVTGGVEVRRLRQLVSPTGELESEVDVVRLEDLDPQRLAREAAEVGLVEAERIDVAATNDHVGSIVCVLEVG